MELETVPNFVVLECTKRCNLNCDHCYANASDKEYAELSLDEIKVLIDDMSQMGVYVFGLVGGEPMLRADIFEILEYAKLKGLSTTISTNGTLIDSNIAQKLKMSEISEISVSVDGLEGFHNKFRNNKCFDEVISGIKNLVNNNINTIVATCVCPQNIEDLDKMSNAIRELNVNSWRLFPVISTGRASKELMLSGKQSEYLKEFILSNKQKVKNIFLGETAGWCGENDEKVKLIPWNGCRAGKEYCAINVEGYLKACPMLSDDYLESSIRSKKFSELWKDRKTFKMFREFNVNKLKGKCKKCNKRKTCEGGCRVAAISQKNDFYDEFPFCSLKF